MVEGSSSRQATSPSLLIFNIIGASLVLGGAYLIWAGDGQKEGFYKGGQTPFAVRGQRPEMGSRQNTFFITVGRKQTMGWDQHARIFSSDLRKNRLNFMSFG